MSKLVFINDRGNSIRQILVKRNSYNSKLDIIKSKIPPGVTLDALTIVKKNYTLKFSSSDLLSLDQLINEIVAVTGHGHDFSRAYLTSISKDEEGHKFILVVDLLTV